MKGQWTPTGDYSGTNYRYIFAQLPNRQTITFPESPLYPIPASKCIIGNKGASPNNDDALDALVNIVAHEV
jgi:hypothetical protein